METRRVLTVLALVLTGIGLGGYGCSASGEPTRPRAREAGVGGGETGGYDPYGVGGSEAGGDDASAGGGGDGAGGATGAGGYDPYGQSGGAGGGGGAPGTGGAGGSCSIPNTLANKLDRPNVWDGVNGHIDSNGNYGYWYSYYDGSSNVAVGPSNSSFGSGIVNGFIEASGTGTFTGYGGGIGASFFNGDPIPVADFSPYKGIMFQFINSVDYGAHFSLNTWDFDPKYCCTTCYANYGFDIPKATVADTMVTYWACWPGITCTGPGADASAEFSNQKQMTLTSSMSGTVKFDPKRVTAMGFVSMNKTQWNFKLGKIRLFN